MAGKPCYTSDVFLKHCSEGHQTILCPSGLSSSKVLFFWNQQDVPACQFARLKHCEQATWVTCGCGGGLREVKVQSCAAQG